MNENTLSSKLTRIENSIAAIKTAANLKDTASVEDVAETANSAISIVATLPPQMKDVNFFDMDGTLLYTYTLEELQSLTDLPTLPERKGFKCQGWN